MKQNLTVFFLFITGMATAQETKSLTDHFTIEGKVAQKLSFSYPDAKNYNPVALDSFVIFNHLHERKRTIHNIKGILLTDLLQKAGIDESNPKLFSEFYFTCIAADGYRVVFSWNEIFNTEVGKGILIVTQADGLKEDSLPERILILSSKDYASGRRYVKGLDKIIVSRVP